MNGEKKFSFAHAYYHSKLAQIMFTYELARRLKGTRVTVNCTRVPNVKIDSDSVSDLPGYLRYMYRMKRFFGIAPEEMAKTYVYLATAPELENVTGKYFDEKGREKDIMYFKYCGEVNTQDVLEAARKRCEEGISTVVIASETGRSALKAVNIFQGMEVDLIVVTHYPASTWGPKGDIPIGLMRDIYAETRQTLIESGVRIVQSTRPFAPPSRSIEWKYPTPEGIIDKTLEIFGAGTKIAVEAALMATDAGVTKEREEVISCAGTYKGLDTALVVRTTFTMNFFAEFEIREIIARPRHRVRKLPEYTYETWKGDLDQYYEGLESGQK